MTRTWTARAGATALIAVLAGACAADARDHEVDIGALDAFPIDAVSEVVVADEQLYITVKPDGGIEALVARDPYLGCIVKWVEEEDRFINPCHGQQYERDGRCVAGPCVRGLDRVAVWVREGRRVVVEPGTIALGAQR